MRAHGISVHTGAAGAGTLGGPAGALFIFHPLQHTHFADWATKMWVYDGIGALERRTLLLVTNYISALTPAL